jgi:hypothetical protein
MRSFASAEPYRRDILLFVEEAVGVVISAIAVPACIVS